MKPQLHVVIASTRPGRVGPAVDGEGAFVSNELVNHSAQQMLDELSKWTGALASLRPQEAKTAESGTVAPRLATPA